MMERRMMGGGMFGDDYISERGHGQFGGTNNYHFGQFRRGDPMEDFISEIEREFLGDFGSFGRGSGGFDSFSRGSMGGFPPF